MRITASQVGPVTPAQLAIIKKMTPGTSTEATSSTDQVVLSRDATAIAAARKTIQDSPEVRQEKVEALKRDIQEGKYHVPSEQIADRILAERRLSKMSGSK